MLINQLTEFYSICKIIYRQTRKSVVWNMAMNGTCIFFLSDLTLYRAECVYLFSITYYITPPTREIKT